MEHTPNTPTRPTDNAHKGQTPADTNPVWKSSKLPVCPYSRRQALADGLQVEVPIGYLRMVHTEWDMLLPSRVFLTKKVVESCQIPVCPNDREGKGRLWEILNVLDVAIGNSFGQRIPFPVSFGIVGKVPLIWFHAVWSTADMDDPTGSITIMMPDED
jgi:hypothetical protein